MPFVFTFATRNGRRCTFCGTAPAPTDAAAPSLPPQVTAQLDGLGAQVAWVYLGAPHHLVIQGESWKSCAPVLTYRPDEAGHLVIH